MRIGEQARDEMVQVVNSQILRDGVEVRRRWAEYFEQVLNVADVREANINVIFIIILESAVQGRERVRTLYQSKDPNPTQPTHGRKKKIKQ